MLVHIYIYNYYGADARLDDFNLFGGVDDESEDEEL